MGYLYSREFVLFRQYHYVFYYCFLNIELRVVAVDNIKDVIFNALYANDYLEENTLEVLK